MQEDFERRRKQRLSLERQWELNLNFLNGNQYVGVNSRGDIYEKNGGEYYWQERGVFNHIAPLIETRIAKLSKLSPEIGVRPKTDDDTDVTGASLAEKAITGLFNDLNFKEIVRKTTLWSESCGTGFYKITWNNQAGKEIGVLGGKKVKQGDVNVVAVSPFEIFPDNLSREELEDCFSIIHARAVSVRDVFSKYGVRVNGEEIDGLNLKSVNGGTDKSTKNSIKDAVIVIEKYVKGCEEYPNGAIITVAGGKLLYHGELPYVNGKDKTRTFPFVKQECVKIGGSFFGGSIVERLIPVQRAYNAVKNRKHEFINRLSTGVMMVEDGSIDVDDLQEEGLAPGKILVYRQGANQPKMMDGFSIPADFNDEEEKLISEFVVISGVSDVASSTRSNKLQSGTALEILVEQDNERILSSAEIIRNCYIAVSRQAIRLYSQFLSGVKMIKFRDDTDKTHVYYLDAKAVNSDDTFIKGENELLENQARKKEIVLSMYEKGLFSDENGVIRPETKQKLLAVLGFKDFDYQKGLLELQAEKANNENARIREEKLPIEEIDDDLIHIEEHTRYAFSEYDELNVREKQNLFEHISEHKKRLNKKTEN